MAETKTDTTTPTSPKPQVKREPAKASPVLTPPKFVTAKGEAANAKKVVVTAVVIAMLLASADDIANGNAPDVRIFIGGAFVVVVLLATADVSPTVAKAFGLMVLVTAVFIRGGAAYAAINKAVKNGKSTPAPKASSSVARTDVGDPIVNQSGQPDANGGFTLQNGTLPGTKNIVPLIP